MDDGTDEQLNPRMAEEAGSRVNSPDAISDGASRKLTMVSPFEKMLVTYWNTTCEECENDGTISPTTEPVPEAHESLARVLWSLQL